MGLTVPVARLTGEAGEVPESPAAKTKSSTTDAESGED